MFPYTDILMNKIELLWYTTSYCNTLQHVTHSAWDTTPCNTLLGKEDETKCCSRVCHSDCLLHLVVCQSESFSDTQHLVPFSTHCNTLQHTATHCNILQHTATYCNTQHLVPSSTHCSTLQHTAAHCNTLQHTATHYTILQYTATCNVLFRLLFPQADIRK